LEPRIVVVLVLLAAADVCLVAAIWLGVGLVVAGAVLFTAFVVAALRFMRVEAEIVSRRGADGTGTAFSSPLDPQSRAGRSVGPARFRCASTEPRS